MFPQGVARSDPGKTQRSMRWRIVLRMRRATRTGASEVHWPNLSKLLVWDKVLGLGTTDPLAGFASITSNLVVSFYFAKRGFENVARIIKR